MEIHLKHDPENRLIFSGFGKISVTEKLIIRLYEFGMFLDYDSVGIKKDGHAAAFLFNWG
jgi:hypothetical protein